MFKLMELEIQKNEFKRYIISTLIVVIVLILSLLLISALRVINLYYDTRFVISATGFRPIIYSTFLVYAAIMINSFVIDEYNSSTVILLYTYPISRKKIIIAKLLLITSYITIITFISNMIVMFIIFHFNVLLHITTDSLVDIFSPKVVLESFIYSLCFSLMSLLSFVVGMINKSKASSLMMSIVISTVFNSGINGVTISNIIVIPIFFAIISIMLSVITINKIEYQNI